MKALHLVIFNLLLVSGSTRAQDSAMVIKPSPSSTQNAQMPIRKGRGTAMPMPSYSPSYRSQIIPYSTPQNRVGSDTVGIKPKRGYGSQQIKPLPKRDSTR